MPSVVSLLNKINAVILNPLIFLMFSVALLYLVFGITKFVVKAGDDKARSEGKNAIMWGIAGMLIMVSVFGIIRFVLTNIGGDTNTYILRGN